MSRKRLKFISELKKGALNKHHDPRTDDESPVPFSEHFTEDDLLKLSEMIDQENDEELAESKNSVEQLNSENNENINPTTCEQENREGNCSSGNPSTNVFAGPRLPLEQIEEPSNNSPSTISNDPNLSLITMPESPLHSNLLNLNANSGIMNFYDSPNLSPYLTQQIVEFGCVDSPAIPCVVSPAAAYVDLPATADLPAAPSANSPAASCVDSENQAGPSRKKRHNLKRKDIGRLRTVHKDQWIDVKRKTCKNLGQEYKSRSGKIRKKREMGLPCGNKCPLKCSEKFSDMERNKLFASFWTMGDLVRHWDYISKYCDIVPKRLTTVATVSRRENTLKYYLPASARENPDDDISPENRSKNQLLAKELRVQVCKTMFLNTLGIKQGLVYSALKKLSAQGTLAADQRGTHSSHRQVITNEMTTSVCDHVNTLCPVESHYLRKETNKKYFDGTLSLARMFILYKEWKDPKKQEKVKTARQYADIVNKNMNIGFHMPKKDQCDVCHVYKNLPQPITEKESNIYKTHIRNKTIARELKNKDKEWSTKTMGIENRSITAVYDFQKVHGMPCGETSILYYKRKLSVFNFTIFDMGAKIAKCYVWDESIASRGANEVSSCLYDFIKENHEKGVKKFNFWSDNCGGQNRNRIVFAAYMRAAKDFEVTITHKYFEKGHTQNEGDSVHSLIERTSKKQTIYTPAQWYALIRFAKREGPPYVVKEMNTPDFIDFKSLMLLPGCNWSQNTDGEKVFWSHTRQLEFHSEPPEQIHYKTDFCKHNFKKIIVVVALETPKTRAKHRQRLEVNQRQTLLLNPLKAAYLGKLPIPAAKIQDLKYLCQINIIPSIYHDFYYSMMEGDEVIESDVDEN